METKKQKTWVIIAIIVLGIIAFLVPNQITAQGVKRIDLQKHDLRYQIEGEKPVTLKAGEVLFIPAGVVHSARNNTNVKASELATYIVEKGKPILVMKK